MMQSMTDAELFDLARHFDLNGECEDHSDAPRKPENTVVCGSVLADFAREAAKRSGVDVSGMSDDDMLAISHSIAPLADCGNHDKIEMLVGDELAKFARAVMAEATKED